VWQWLPDVPEAAAPGTPDLLHPRTLLEIIDDTIELYRRNWRAILPISALFMVPIGALSAVAQLLVTRELGSDLALLQSGLSPELAVRLALIGLVLAVLWIVGRAFISGFVARFIADLFLGRSPTRRDVSAFTLRHLGKLIAVYLIYLILLFLGLVPGFILAFTPYFFFLAVFRFDFVAVVVEGAGVFRAFGRSWELSKGFRWKVLSTVVLVFLVTRVATYGLSALSLMMAGGIGFLSGAMQGAIQVAGYLAQTVGLVFTTPMQLIAATLLYFDLRVRKEGFDLALEAQELGAPAA
jgi:hypothetical protein